MGDHSIRVPLLSRQPGIDQVNLRQPGGKTLLRALKPGEALPLNRHAPHRYIVGGGFLASSTTRTIGELERLVGKRAPQTKGISQMWLKAWRPHLTTEAGSVFCMISPC